MLLGTGNFARQQSIELRGKGHTHEPDEFSENISDPACINSSIDGKSILRTAHYNTR